jgi:uncharacterized protein YeeX (DUF496 family)
MQDKKLIMIKILKKYRKKALERIFLIFMLSVCYISCTHSVDLDIKYGREYTGLMRLYNDTSINILENKKAGDWIFSTCRKNAIKGLISVYKDSIMFINDSFFPSGDGGSQSLDFMDFDKIVVNVSNVSGNKTLSCKYIFSLNRFSNNWTLVYAEKKEFTGEQSVYHFTDILQTDISMCNFSTEHAFMDLFANEREDVFQYKYRKSNYLDSIETQVNRMRLANVASFKNIFTLDHAEKILQDYPLNKTNVIFLNNIAYYLERTSITMPAIAILETIVSDYPDRIVSYLNLSDALLKNNLKVKAEKIYSQYTKMKNNSTVARRSLPEHATLAFAHFDSVFYRFITFYL